MLWRIQNIMMGNRKQSYLKQMQPSLEDTVQTRARSELTFQPKLSFRGEKRSLLKDARQKE